MSAAAAALIDAALEVARGRGFREAILWMLEGNDRAGRFYDRQGWTRDGGMRQAEYPGVDHGAEEPPTEIRFRRALNP